MKKGIEGLVRLGYLAKAIVYILVGVLALKVAAGVGGGRITDPGGALYVVLRKPYGQVMLILIAVGLCTYAGWKIWRAFAGHHAGKNGLHRALSVIRACVYGAVGVKAAKLVLGLRGGDSGPEPLVREALRWPLGEWMIMVAAVGVGWYGVVEILDAWKGRLEPDLDAPTLRQRAGDWAVSVARGGIGARGVLMIVLAFGLLRAATMRRPSAAGGLDTSLSLLNTMPQGTLLLGVAAAGVLAYGVYQLLHARYAQV